MAIQRNAVVTSDAGGRAYVPRSGRGAEMDGQIEIPAALNLARDQVRWGPIVAGLLTALTATLLLNLLGVALGLTSLNAASAARQNNVPQNAGQYAAIWAGVSGMLAFLLGGCVAGRTAPFSIAARAL